MMKILASLIILGILNEAGEKIGWLHTVLRWALVISISVVFCWYLLVTFGYRSILMTLGIMFLLNSLPLFFSHKTLWQFIQSKF